MNLKCIAYHEQLIRNLSGRTTVAYVPCTRPTAGKRFCIHHERSYREIFIGILQYKERRSEK